MMIAAVNVIAAAQSRFGAALILFLHNRYRTTGGEERAVAELMALVRDELGEEAELLERDSAQLGRGRAARGMLRGGLDPDEVAAAVRRTGARIVHAHNLHPSFGARALAAARDAGARVVLHLHNYRLVCAVGTCFNSRGEDCIRCQGRNTLPGVRLNCRGESRGEALTYALALARQQRALVEHADVIVVPSQMAGFRLVALEAPIRDVHVVGHVVSGFAERSTAAAGTYALVVSRLAREKGIEVAIEACRIAGVELVVAGDGPHPLPRDQARFVGRVDEEELGRLRAGAGLAIVPSRSFETYGLAAVEAMAAGLPVVASRMGALAEIVDEDGLVPPNDPDALAEAIKRRFGDPGLGRRSIEAAYRLAAPALVAERLSAAYEAASLT
jgi:glycosyltransferase involved in cell wall biosynthesis